MAVGGGSAGEGAGVIYLWFDGFSVWSYDDSFVDTVLMRYMWRKVKKFHLDIKEEYYHSNIDSWIHFAIDHQVEEFFLNLNNCGWDNWWEDYTWSPLLNHCSSLTKLCLRGCRFSSSDSISWSSLKSLSIQNVSDDVLQKILMGSPILEHLNLIGCRSVKGIQSRSLRELVIDACWADYPLEISTPCLLSLRVRSAYFCKSIRIIEAPSLVKAELDFGPAKSDCRLLKELLFKLQNATQILFGAWCFQVMLPLKVEDVQDSLLNCKSLTLHVPIREFSFPAIANMLATTPNLEKLVIKFELSAWDASWVYSLNSKSHV
ncbi:F-box/LRR-repeat protein At3g03360-like [Syzygium oleosum]|uniref:F-box/LRR-repeat protein At3g03360-like n=1 Tax=Syzygium oleosum TaxID=219896 RepID=UPI0024BA76FD|nr:F-box/LRR-repeat protein At3g03360-like [Syzygium oleosum]